VNNFNKVFKKIKRGKTTTNERIRKERRRGRETKGKFFFLKK
jgi:hypothetical protein